MKAGYFRRPLLFALVITFVISLCGCNEGMKWRPVYDAAIIGGVVGVIVGHQYDEDCSGAAIGAAIGAAGVYLEQYDELASADNVVVEVAGTNGSIIPVVLKKHDGVYICRNGERYNQLPSQEELKLVYGL
jgi:hypothetical protein